MTKKLEQCANCGAEIYEAGDGSWYHLKTSNRWCVFGFISSPTNLEKYAGKVAEPRKAERDHLDLHAQTVVPGNGF